MIQKLPDPALAFWRSLFRRWRERDELWRKITRSNADGESQSGESNMVSEIRQLHERHDDGTCCECEEIWPCSAMRLVDENERLQAEVLKWQVEAGKFGPGMEAMEDLLEEARIQLANERADPFDQKLDDLTEHCDKGAKIIAELLCVALRMAEIDGRHLAIWERDGIEWLRRQWEFDKSTSINMWVADRYVSNTKLDLYGKMSEFSIDR